MKNRPDLETHLMRKDLVRNYGRLGLSIPIIIRRLDEQGFFSPTQSYNARYSIVVRLLRSVKREDAKSYRVTQEDSNQARAEYLDRANYLYSQAIQLGDLRLAHDISMSIARAHGINTKEPIKVETNFYEVMLQASQMARANAALRKPSIEVTPLLPEKG